MEILKIQTTGKTKIGEHVTLNYTINNSKDGKVNEVNGSIEYDGYAIGYVNVKTDKLLMLNVSQESEITKEELTNAVTTFINDSYGLFKN